MKKLSITLLLLILPLVNAAPIQVAANTICGDDVCQMGENMVCPSDCERTQVNTLTNYTVVRLFMILLLVVVGCWLLYRLYFSKFPKKKKARIKRRSRIKTRAGRRRK